MSSEIQAELLKSNFPTLTQEVNGKPLVYLDNAATTQKPLSVIERINQFYKYENATVHRGVYYLSQEATRFCDEVREAFAAQLGAKPEETIFVRGTTEAINLVANSYVKHALKEGDEILISAMEHHANIVPWQLLCEEKGFILKVIPITDDGEIDLDAYDRLLNEKTKFVSLVHISNSLGTINPVKVMINKAKLIGAKVMIDGAQSFAHTEVKVHDLGCDYYCFSGHKIYGPTGIGILYGDYALLEQMKPYQGGGDMIESVSFEKTTFAQPPAKFEAGTPSIAQIIGLGEALNYIQNIGFEAIEAYEAKLNEKINAVLPQIKGVRPIGTATNKTSIFSFVLDGVHPHDAGTVLDEQGIAVRVGHHCTQPIMTRYKVPATIRASFTFYNTLDEVDILAEGIQKTLEIMT